MELKKSGFLIVKTYEKLCEDYAGRYNLTKDLYGIPRIDRVPEINFIKYRGIDRDALSPVNDSNLVAEIRFSELKPGARKETDELLKDFLFDYQNALAIYESLGELKTKYEIIWVKIANSNDWEPEGFTSLGYEPSYFYCDHFSASCDCMLIPRWHGTDSSGIQFKAYFKKLNQYGLFHEPETTANFLEYYLSFDWTERGDYWITEVFAK